MTQYLRENKPLVFLGGVAVLAGLTLGFTQHPAPPTPGVTPVKLAVDDQPVRPTGREFFSFAPVVRKVGPSVVKVFTTGKANPGASPEQPDFDNPMFRWFFGPEAGGPPGRRTPPPRSQGIGSGVVVSEDGYILTNNHVVENADEVRVSLPDGREFTAKVVGKDPKTDVAVLKVGAQGLPFLHLADSDKIEVGDVVLAVGNPFGIGQTVTTGIVSAKGRGNMGLDYEDFIQTDAAINPGNSGGALVDVEGRLIGINTAILSRSGGNQGIGFAIPGNLARYVMEDLVRDGRVARGFLGVMIQDVTPALAREFGLKNQTGALVGEVTPGGPADKAGLKSGDVITEFNGKPVPDSRQLKLQAAQARPGSKVAVKILREGAVRTLEARLKELPGTEKLAQAGPASGAERDQLDGVTVTDLDPRLRRQFGVPGAMQGAVVTAVEPDSKAQAAGLRPGDVILELNRQPVKNADDAVRLTQKDGHKATLVKLWREGGSRYVVVDEAAG